MKFYDNKEKIMDAVQVKLDNIDKITQGIEFLKEELKGFDNKVLNNRVVNIIKKNHKEVFGWDYSNNKDYCNYSIDNNGYYSNEKCIRVYVGYENEAYIPIALNDNRIVIEETLDNIEQIINKLNTERESLLMIDDNMLSNMIERKEHIETLISELNRDATKRGLIFVDDFYIRIYN